MISWNERPTTRVLGRKLLYKSGNSSISKIVNDVQQTGAGALLIVTNYILGLIWGNDSINLFDSHSKDENGNLSSSGTAVLNIDTLCSLENCVRLVYYNVFPLTLHFQVSIAKNVIKYELNTERC